jgi:hypothetical protein
MLGAGVDVDPALDPIAPHGRARERQAEDYRARAFADDIGIGPVERDAQLVRATRVGEVAVPQVKASRYAYE